LSDQENLPALHYVKPLRAIRGECTMRVEGPNVEFHGDVAARCLEVAIERRARTTFYAFELIPECDGVVTGKVGDGQPALFAEACAPGLSFVKNHCTKPVAKNGDCDESPGGILGDPKEHPRCEAGLDCFQTGFGADGTELVFKCLTPQAIGDACKLEVNACASGSSCYQGKCRERAQAAGDCMTEGDCVEGLACEIRGGVFGHCLARK
jgi:hypothetical protein